jgi:hypothetical protein
MTNQTVALVDLSIEEIEQVDGAKGLIKAVAEFLAAVAEGWALAHS